MIPIITFGCCCIRMIWRGYLDALNEESVAEVKMKEIKDEK